MSNTVCFSSIPSTAVTVAANTVTWFSNFESRLLGQTTESFVQAKLRTTGTLSLLYIRVFTNSVSASSTLITRKNTANGSLTLSIPSNTTGEFEDVSNTESITAGDILNYQLTTGATGTTMVPTIISSVFTANTNTVKKLASFGVNGSTTASTTTFFTLGGYTDGGDPTEVNNQYKTRVPGTLTNLYVNISANSRTAATTFKSRKNTADGGLTVSVGSTATGAFEDTTHTDTLAVGDLITLAMTTGVGTQIIVWRMFGAEFTSTGNQFFLAVASSNGSGAWAPATTRWVAVGGHLTAVATESATQCKARISFTASNLFLRIKSNTITAASTWTLRQNGASTGLSVSITASTTGTFEDTVDTVNIAPTDKINHQFVGGATGTNIQLDVAYISGLISSPYPNRAFWVTQAINRSNTY